jgi:aminoglycoside/choline kinase family phosphotransferase
MQRDAEIAEITPLVPEASTRRYYRLHLEGGATLVGVHEDEAAAIVNMQNVIAVQRFLATGGVAVPQIYSSDIASGVMLQQDLGDTSLNQILKDQPDNADLYYQDAILHMLSWQRLVNDGTCPAFMLSFDVEKLMFEFEFFIEHTLLGYYHAEVTDTELSEIRAAFLKIAEELAAYPNKVLTHRDYHSRNIMVVGGRQYIIDFQDARMGLFQYDLCSLLCDAYAPLSVGRRAHLLDFAFEQGKEIHRQTRAEFDHYWRLSAFQRTVKAMGTFGRQAALGRDDFAAYLTPAWQMLREFSDQYAELRLLADRLRGYTLCSQG